MYLTSDGYAELHPAGPAPLTIAFQNCKGCNFSYATCGWPERYPSVSEQDVIAARVSMNGATYTATVINLFQAKTLG